MMYDEVRDGLFLPAPPADAGFELLDRKTVSFAVKPESAEDLGNLFMMTPFFHRVPEERRREIENAGPLTVTAGITLSLFRRMAQDGGKEAGAG